MGKKRVITCYGILLALSFPFPTHTTTEPMAQKRSRTNEYDSSDDAIHTTTLPTKAKGKRSIKQPVVPQTTLSSSPPTTTDWYSMSQRTPRSLDGGDFLYYRYRLETAIHDVALDIPTLFRERVTIKLRETIRPGDRAAWEWMSERLEEIDWTEKLSSHAPSPWIDAVDKLSVHVNKPTI